MVVFNFPANDTTTKENDSAWPYYDMVRYFEAQGAKYPKQYVHENYTVITRPVDKRENYIKRCVGMPGDKLFIKDSELFINDNRAFEAEHIQFTYVLTSDKEIVKMQGDNAIIDQDILHELLELGIAEKEIEAIMFENPNKTQINAKRFITKTKEIKVYTNKNIAKKIESIANIGTVTKWIYNNAENDYKDKKRMYPNTDKAFRNNVDNYGPIVIPYKGLTIPFNKDNYLMYERCIRVYEGNTLAIKNGKAYLNGTEVKEYTFKMDYYWMMGDNRHRSQDSRYWGFVPEDHIVGRASILIASNGVYDGFRWNRVFKLIHSKWAPKEAKYTD